MYLALTHRPSPRLADCELTFIDRQGIDLARAGQQHADYRATLSQLGAEVQDWTFNEVFPDGAFVEDTAVILDEVAIVASPFAASRRGETAKVAEQLARWRPVEHIRLPGTLEGGDVLAMGRHLLVGESVRTNAAGIAQLTQLVAPHGYQVRPIPVAGCLHLKTACCGVTDSCLLINPDWLPVEQLSGFDVIEVPAAEPFAANVLRLAQELCLSSSHPRTMQLLRDRGYSVTAVEISEFEKAEAGTTCLSLILRA